MNLTRAWPLTRLCHYDNATHRTGKYHMPFTFEVPRNVDLPRCHEKPAIKQQNLTQDPVSSLRDRLPQCADLHCDLHRLSFIFRSWRPASNKEQNSAQVPPWVCVTNAVTKMIYCPHTHRTFPSGENESVAFFLLVGRNKQMQELAPFTKERRAVFGAFVVKKRKGSFSTQLYSQWGSDGNDSP